MNYIFRTLLTLCALMTSAFAAEHASCRDCNDTFIITKEHFCHHGKESGTVVITKPGNYCLADTIHWCPKKCHKTAIVIDASNVTLDLSGHELKQVNSRGRCSGILVISGHDTVKIVNGAVRDFTQLGIVVEGGTSNIFLGSDDSFLKVTGCGYGSTFSFLDNVTQEPILQGGILLGQTKALESRGYYTWQGNIETANLINVFAEENGPAGMYLGTGSNIISENCYFCQNTESRQTGYADPFGTGLGNANMCTVLGLLYSAHPGFGDNDSNTIEFLNCHFDNNTNNGTGLPQFSTGLTMGYNINGLTFHACTFNSNKGLGAEGGRGMFGAILGGCKGVLYESCQANNNYNENGPTEGLHHSGSNGNFDYIISPEGVTFRECTADRNISRAETFPTATGFSLFFMDGFTMEDCTAINNTAFATDPDNAFGYSDGLILVGAPNIGGQMKNGVVSGCHFSGNKTNFAGGDAEGIYVQTPLSNLVIKNCVIQDNTGADFNSGIWAVGAADGEMFGIVIEDCVIEDQSLGIYSNGDTNSIYQNNTITNVDFGVLLDTSSCDSINNNYVTNAASGFVDFANPSSSLFSNNRVFGAVTPYDVTYAFGPVPVVSGSLVTGFPTGAEVLDNVFMDNPTCQAPPVAAAAKAKSTLKSKVAKARKMRQARAW